MEALRIHSIQELEAQLSQLEELVCSNEEATSEHIGEQLAEWEKLVMRTSDFALALRIGDLLERSRHFWLALSWYQWVVAAQKGQELNEHWLRALRSKGRIYIRLRMYQEALPLLKQVEEGIEQIGTPDPNALPFLLQNISIVYGQLGQHEEAVSYGQRALALISEQGDIHRTSMVEGTIASNLSALQRFDEALDYMTRSRMGFEKCRDQINLARSWHNYAELMRDWGRMEEAVAAWRMSLEIKKRTLDYVGQVNTLLSITQYFISRDDWHGALGYVMQAFPLCHQHRLYDKEVHCLEAWSSVLYALGRFSELEVVMTRAKFLAEHAAVEPQVQQLLATVSGYFKQTAH